MREGRGFPYSRERRRGDDEDSALTAPSAVIPSRLSALQLFLTRTPTGLNWPVPGRGGPKYGSHLAAYADAHPGAAVA